MMSYKQFVLSFALVVCFVGTANAVKCYQCESSYNKDCGDELNVDKLQIVDCSKIPRPRYIVGSKNSTSCVKMVKEEYGKTNIVRACFFENAMDTKSQCLVDPNAQAVHKSCDLCTTDLCNTASTTFTMPIALFSVLAVGGFFINKLAVF